jgi:hypothetical protein
LSNTVALAREDDRLRQRCLCLGKKTRERKVLALLGDDLPALIEEAHQHHGAGRVRADLRIGRELE